MANNRDTGYPDIESIPHQLSEAVRDRYRERFVGLWRHGPQARDDAGPESDIDVLLTLTQSERPAPEVDRYAHILANPSLVRDWRSC
jgi:predicted nucleotidyltransferase